MNPYDLGVPCELCRNDPLLCEAVRYVSRDGCPHPTRNPQHAAIVADVVRMMPPPTPPEPWRYNPTPRRKMRCHVVNAPWRDERNVPAQSHDVGAILDAIGVELGREWRHHAAELLADQL